MIIPDPDPRKTFRIRPDLDPQPCFKVTMSNKENESLERYLPCQLERAKKVAGALCWDFFPPSKTTLMVLDDESNFPLKDNIMGHKGFHVVSDP